MPNRTIYLSDDDLSLLSEAKALTGKSGSATVVMALRALLSQPRRPLRVRGRAKVKARKGGGPSTL